MAKQNFCWTKSFKNALQTGLAAKVNHGKETKLNLFGQKAKIKLTTAKLTLVLNTGHQQLQLLNALPPLQPQISFRSMG